MIITLFYYFEIHGAIDKYCVYTFDFYINTECFLWSQEL